MRSNAHSYRNSISRSSFYYAPKGESPENLALMRRIDELFLKYPFYGSRQMVRQLRRDGVCVGRHRVRRLMRLMGLEAIYQAPRTSTPHPTHRIYPYLLKGIEIDRPNQVWCADITYIPVQRGFLYLIAIMDWATRHVLSWRLSNTMDARFCIDALNAALADYGNPEISNTDQGSQFTGFDFTGVLKNAGVRISMDGRGRCMDNIFIERLWRSLKYEAVYLHELTDGFCQRRSKSTPLAGVKMHHLMRFSPPGQPWAGLSGFWGFPSFLALVETVAVAVHLQDMNVVCEPVQQRPSQALGTEHLGPLIER